MCSLDPVSIIHGCIEIPSLRDICGCGGPINLCRAVVMYMHFQICIMTKRQELKTPARRTEYTKKINGLFSANAPPSHILPVSSYDLIGQESLHPVF